MDIESKIYQIADKIADTDENTEVIRSWERQLDQIRISDEFIKFPETLRLKEIAMSEIGKINRRLLYEKNISIEERNALILIREAHETYLRILGANPEMDKRALESEIDNSIRGLKG